MRAVGEVVHRVDADDRVERVGLERQRMVDVRHLEAKALGGGGALRATRRRLDALRLRVDPDDVAARVLGEMSGGAARAAGDLQRARRRRGVEPGEEALVLQEFLPTARAKEIGVVTMKVYAGGALVGAGRKVKPGDFVRWALAQDGVTLAVPGAEMIPHWDEARPETTQPLPDEKEQARIAEAVGAHHEKKCGWSQRD